MVAGAAVLLAGGQASATVRCVPPGFSGLSEYYETLPGSSCNIGYPAKGQRPGRPTARHAAGAQGVRSAPPGSGQPPSGSGASRVLGAVPGVGGVVVAAAALGAGAGRRLPLARGPLLVERLVATTGPRAAVAGRRGGSSDLAATGARGFLAALAAALLGTDAGTGPWLVLFVALSLALALGWRARRFLSR
jgi:hypothetical protein